MTSGIASGVQGGIRIQGYARAEGSARSVSLPSLEEGSRGRSYTPSLLGTSFVLFFLFPPPAPPPIPKSLLSSSFRTYSLIRFY